MSHQQARNWNSQEVFCTPRRSEHGAVVVEGTSQRWPGAGTIAGLTPKSLPPARRDEKNLPGPNRGAAGGQKDRYLDRPRPPGAPLPWARFGQCYRRVISPGGTDPRRRSTALMRNEARLLKRKGAADVALPL